MSSPRPRGQYVQDPAYAATNLAASRTVYKLACNKEVLERLRCFDSCFGKLLLDAIALHHSRHCIVRSSICSLISLYMHEHLASLTAATASQLSRPGRYYASIPSQLCRNPSSHQEAYNHDSIQHKQVGRSAPEPQGREDMLGQCSCEA